MTKKSCCRACLECKPKMVSIFEPYRSFNIAHFISSLTDIEITKSQKNFPKHLCSVCLEELEVVLNFKKKCKDTDKYLKSLSRIPTEPCDTTEVKVEPIDKIKSEKADDFYGTLELDCEYDNDNIADEEQDMLDVNVDAKQVEESNSKEGESVFSVPNYSYYECHDCGERLRTKCKLRVHWKKTHDYLTCEKCKKVFKAFKAFKNHSERECINTNMVKIVGEGKNRQFHCRHCDYETPKSCYIRQHLVRHTGKRAYRCDICGKDYTQLNCLNDHKERAHQQYRLELTCDHCGKHIKGRTRWYNHSKTHLNTKVQCDICKAFLKTKRILLLHIKNHYEQKKQVSVACEVCGKVYSSVMGLKKHINLVHFTTTHSCKMCKFQHKNIAFLKKHERQHLQENMIQCSLCFMFYNGQKLLDLHMHNKHGSRSHFCVFCKKGFNKRHTCLKHQDRVHAEQLKSHTGPTFIRLSARERSKLDGVKPEELINMMTMSA